MNKEEKELINNYVKGSKVYSNGEIKDKEAMVKALNELAEYNNKKFHFTTALIKLNRIKDGDTSYKFDEMEATEILDYINQLETNRDEALKTTEELYEEGVEWHWDNSVLETYVSDLLSILERGKE